MKRLLLATLTLVMVFAVAGFATETRVMTLGDANGIVVDDANIWMYPSTILQHPNMAIGEFCMDSYGESYGWDMQSLGMHYAIGENGKVIGAYLKKMDYMDIYYLPNGVNIPGSVPNPDHRLDLFFGTPMGDNGLGVHLSYYNQSMSTDSDDDKTAVAATAFKLGVGMTFSESTDVAAHFGMTMWTNEDDEGNAINEPDGNMTFDLGGRHFMELTDMYTAVPHAGFMFHSEGIKGEGMEDIKSTAMGIDVGWGTNFVPDDRILCVGDFGIMYFNEKEEFTPDEGDASEVTYTDFVLPYFRLGIEGNVTDWWDVRLGATKYWHMYKLDFGDAGTYNEKYASTETYLGSGFYFGNLTLDVQINPDFVQYGPNFISGYNESLAYRVSLLYNFGE
ncbi:YgdI/YgdR family lipoprotein [bacterium]|nr:YgdI/YgdR family lipoprotein [bacterium]MBU1651159.1 YgdI/YgdR family lipoprotein [bacterium]MBU1881677.1 YgdI/YgdR family lipoprotein [bacterium]